MLQELTAILRTTRALVDEIEARFQRGDAASTLVARAVAQTRMIGRYVARIGNDLPDECRIEIAQLLETVDRAVKTGDGWLSEATGPALAAQVLRQRISRAYGVTN